VKPIRLTGKAMEELRRKVWERASQRCEDCNLWVPLNGELMWRMHLAHIVSRGRGGDDSELNTRCLCAECHGKEHNCNGKPVPAKVSA
jgi:hypothetical protein